MSVVWSPEARADLVDIRNYIAAENRERVVSFVMEITEAGEAISDMPRAFPLVPRLEHRGIRQRIYRQYLIFYRLEDQDVHILHVAHGARDYIKALFMEE
ncbi:MAG: type II toxin-antitoxin system RelE/ParE family toxin [Azospirillum sp.]|nr:type II toxin-antitoxin system RelE/ParE family toxin [Azospirillum sp.]